MGPFIFPFSFTQLEYWVVKARGECESVRGEVREARVGESADVVTGESGGGDYAGDS